MIELADRVGRQHLPVSDGVSDINEFLEEDAVHHDLAKQIVRTIYRANRCGFLDAKVDATATFDALGKIQGEVLRDEAADFDQVALLQNLGHAAAQILPVPAVKSAPGEGHDPDADPDKIRRNDQDSDHDSNHGSGNNVRTLVRQTAVNSRRS